MQLRFAKLLLLAALIGGAFPASAQVSDETMAALKRAQQQTEAMKAEMDAAPASRSGRAMEADWVYADEAPDGQIGEKPGPYLVSLWGNIVVRGRREGDRIISAYGRAQCGRDGDDATEVTFLGRAPAGLCANIKPVPQGKQMLVQGDGFILFGDPQGWAIVDFAQNISGHFVNGQPDAKGAVQDSFSLTSTGAFYKNENGRHVFYAPGETVAITGALSITVKPVMTLDEIDADLKRQALANADDDKIKDIIRNSQQQRDSAPKPRPNYFDLAVLLSVIAGAGYFILRWIRRRRSAGSPAAPTGFNPADIPVGKRQADVFPVTGTAASASPKPADGLLWWRAQPLAKRRAIIIATAAVLLFCVLFVVLRPAEADETALMRQAMAHRLTSEAQSAFDMDIGEEPLSGSSDGGGQATVVDGHQARFAVYRSANTKLVFDTFTTPTAADAVLVRIHGRGPEEALLLPPDGGAATPFAEALGVRGAFPIHFECRRAAGYLSCMTRPRRTAMLLTVRVPNDTEQTIVGVNDAKTLVATEASLAIKRLNAAGIGGLRAN